MDYPYRLHVRCLDGKVNKDKYRDSLNKDLTLEIRINCTVETKKKIDGRLNEEWDEVFSIEISNKEIADDDVVFVINSKGIEQTMVFFKLYTLPIGKVIEDTYKMWPIDSKLHCIGEVHLILQLAPAEAKPFVPCEIDNKYLENLQSTNASLQTENNDLKEKIEEYEKEIEEKKSEFEKMSKEVKSLRHTDSWKDERVKDLQDTNRSLKSNIENLEKQIKGNNELIKDAKDKDKKITQLKQDLKDVKKSIKSNEEDFNNQLKTKESKIQKLENEKDELNRDLQDKDQNIAQLTKELEDANIKIQNSKKQREEIKNLMGEKSLFYDFLRRFVKDANEQFLSDNS